MSCPQARFCYVLGSLAELAKTFCPELGVKGEFKHEEVTVATIEKQKEPLLAYLRQDIRLLAGVVQRAQDLFWEKYRVDITSCLTLSALAMLIFRARFYKEKAFPIHIPTKNQDAFEKNRRSMEGIVTSIGPTERVFTIMTSTLSTPS
ncbi:hypothetical protein GIB67_013212 [Kingdonia uniflora]|uniref:DNA-directed DNA polymerase n=1 Tax=Kingdonia uniflora TaxID=39325 RepID=A0A7J7NRC3_9MAGN|nr:hypothetical protein GIB67_013212 [Kingdonia uniflora]